MHYSRLCAVLIDCNVPDVAEAAGFWGAALGRAPDPKHPGSRGNYFMLETPPDEVLVRMRAETLGAKVVDRIERWVVMQAPTGQRFCVVRAQRPGFPKNATRWGE